MRKIILSSALVLILVACTALYFTYARAPLSAGRASAGNATASSSSVTAGTSAGSLTYTNTQFGFSLSYPDGLSATDVDEDAGEHTVTFEDATGGKEFQIFVVPYTGAQITQSRIELDTHGSATTTPQEIVLANGTHALAFFSSDALAGDMREVWFIRGGLPGQGYLFEVTTPKPLDTWLGGIMQSWVFI